jgi:hypothetical protein
MVKLKGIKTLRDMERAYIIWAMTKVSSLRELHTYLGITARGLYDKMKRYDIPSELLGMECEEYHKKKESRNIKYDLNHRLIASDCPPDHAYRFRDVTTSVTPEERDFFYNLDFLVGIYDDENLSPRKRKNQNVKTA